MIAFLAVISPICILHVPMYKSKIIDKQYIGEHLNPHPHLQRLERLFLVHYCGFTIDHTLLKWEGITDFVALPSVTWRSSLHLISGFGTE